MSRINCVRLYGILNSLLRGLQQLFQFGYDGSVQHPSLKLLHYVVASLDAA
jgi:hypothetical protein